MRTRENPKLKTWLAVSGGRGRPISRVFTAPTRQEAVDTVRRFGPLWQQDGHNDLGLDDTDYRYERDDAVFWGGWDWDLGRVSLTFRGERQGWHLWGTTETCSELVREGKGGDRCGGK